MVDVLAIMHKRSRKGSELSVMSRDPRSARLCNRDRHQLIMNQPKPGNTSAELKVILSTSMILSFARTSVASHHSYAHSSKGKLLRREAVADLVMRTSSLPA